MMEIHISPFRKLPQLLAMVSMVHPSPSLAGARWQLALALIKDVKVASMGAKGPKVEIRLHRLI